MRSLARPSALVSSSTPAHRRWEGDIVEYAAMRRVRELRASLNPTAEAVDAVAGRHVATSNPGV